MIDVHTHVLPGIDDGAQNIQETLIMLNEAYTAGFSDIITTSHYIDGHFDVNKSDRKVLIDSIQELLKNKINLHNGAEAYISPDLVEFYNNQTIPTLAGSRYVLFELPMNSDILYLNEIITELINNDYIPIIAHPERYKSVQMNFDKAVQMIQKGALLQCNYGSFIGDYGHEAQKTAVKLLKTDKISFLGSDAHRCESIYSQIGEVLDKLEKTVGYDKVEQLTVTNPQKILNNEYF